MAHPHHASAQPYVIGSRGAVQLAAALGAAGAIATLWRRGRGPARPSCSEAKVPQCAGALPAARTVVFGPGDTAVQFGAGCELGLLNSSEELYAQGDAEGDSARPARSSLRAHRRTHCHCPHEDRCECETGSVLSHGSVSSSLVPPRGSRDRTVCRCEGDRSEEPSSVPGVARTGAQVFERALRATGTCTYPRR